jgi:DNA-directed RNA polymerase subunit L
MNIEIIKAEKDEIELKIDNLTIAEVLRAYLYENGADFAAWRREHPSKPIILRIQSKDKSVKKVVGDAVAALVKDCDNLIKAVKK